VIRGDGCSRGDGWADGAERCATLALSHPTVHLRGVGVGVLVAFDRVSPLGEVALLEGVVRELQRGLFNASRWGIVRWCCVTNRGGIIVVLFEVCVRAV